jgi:fluoride exporter
MEPEEREAAPNNIVDPGMDALRPARMTRPPHLRASYIGLVFAGGVLGTLARYGVSHLVPAPGGWPLPTLTVNLCGSFALGLLLEALIRRGTDTGRRRVTRLLAGTGFMGAFTTYSTLALEANGLFADGNAAAAVTYLGAGLVGGTLAAWAGVLTGAAHHRHKTARARTMRPEAGKDDR